MEKERGLNKILLRKSKSNSRTGGKEPICTNATSMEEDDWIERWMLVRFDAETLFTRIILSFSRTFNTMNQKTRFSNIVCEKHRSALSF